MSYCRNCGAFNEPEERTCYKCNRPLDYAADCEDLRASKKKLEYLLGNIFWICVFFEPLVALIIGYFLPKNFPKRKAGMVVAGVISLFWIFVGIIHLLS